MDTEHDPRNMTKNAVLNKRCIIWLSFEHANVIPVRIVTLEQETNPYTLLNIRKFLSYIFDHVIKWSEMNIREMCVDYSNKQFILRDSSFKFHSLLLWILLSLVICFLWYRTSFDGECSSLPCVICYIENFVTKKIFIWELRLLYYQLFVLFHTREDIN